MAAGNISRGAPAFEYALLHVRDEKATGTAGGTFTAGALRTRDLNTVKTNEIVGASLASNQITLPAGTYFIDAEAPAYIVGEHKALLRNVTDGTNTIIGSNEFVGTGAQASSFCRVMGRFTIAAAKVFEIQHYAQNTGATTGFGRQTSLAGAFTEVYTDVKIWKVR